MPANVAVSAFGSKLQIGDGGGSEIFTDIADVVSISGPSPDGAMIDVTHLLSPDNTREKIAGLLDPADVTFDLNFVPGLAGHKVLMADMKSRVKRNFKLIFSDTTTWPFTGVINGVSPELVIDQEITASVRISLTKLPTYPA